jgi:diketogulonate reductase-like aldo/keto reductase
MGFPKVGLGVLFADGEVLESAIIYAVEQAGYRAIDTAAYYGNEAVVGSAIQKVLAKGKIKREELFITTKLKNYHHKADLVEKALRESLGNLRLDYVDLYLIHWPQSEAVDEADWTKPKTGADGKAIYDHVDILETWGAMEKVHAAGLAKHIGVSNFSIEMLERMEFSPKVHVQPYTNQVELSLYCQQRALLAYMAKRGMALTAFSPLGGSPILGPGPYGVQPLSDPVLVEVAKEVGKTPAQVVLKFLLGLSPVVHVIPKSVTPERIQKNIDLDFVLSGAQVAKLEARNLMHRGVNLRALWGIDPHCIGA